MLKPGNSAPLFSLSRLDGGDWRLELGKPSLLVFFETDCPTCQLTIPYLNRLAQALDGKAEIVGISQDGEAIARAQAAALGRTDLDAVYVEHPIQDQLISEIHQKAEDAIESIVFALTRRIP